MNSQSNSPEDDYEYEREFIHRRAQEARKRVRATARKSRKIVRIWVAVAAMVILYIVVDQYFSTRRAQSTQNLPMGTETTR